MSRVHSSAYNLAFKRMWHQTMVTFTVACLGVPLCNLATSSLWARVVISVALMATVIKAHQAQRDFMRECDRDEAALEAVMQVRADIEEARERIRALDV